MSSYWTVVPDGISPASGHADPFFRYHDGETTEETDSGDVESPFGHFTLRLIEQEQIDTYGREHGFDTVAHVHPGWYIDVRNERGLIWAFDFRGDEQAARDTYARLEEAYAAWAEEMAE